MAKAELWVEKRGPLTIALILEGGKITAIEVDHDDLKPRSGDVLPGKIARMMPKLRAAEVETSAGLAFLDLGKKKMKVGDKVNVEWLSPAVRQKLQVVNLAGAVAKGPSALERVVAGRVVKLARVQAALKKEAEALGLTIELEKSPFELMDLDAQIEGLLARHVPLAGGAGLVIDRTEALTVIDVNGGSQGVAANKAALVEIARQLRLRNIGGVVLIDIVGKGSATMLEELRRATSDDPCPVEVFGITKLGLIEMARARRGYELSRVLK